MNTKVLTFVSIAAIFLSTVTSLEFEGKSASNETIFSLSNHSNEITLVNLHRAKQTTKLVFEGVTLQNVTIDHSSQFWTIVLSDHSTLQLNYSQHDDSSAPNISHFSLNWHRNNQSNQSANHTSQLCLQLNHHQGQYWYSAYQSMRPRWPMEPNLTTETRQPFNHLFNYDRFTHRNDSLEHLYILEHLFLNSDAFALWIDPSATSLWVSRFEGRLCLSTSSYSEDTTSTHDNLDLALHVYTGANIRSVRDHVIHHSGLIERPTSIPDKSNFECLTWFGWEMDYYGASLLNESAHNNFSINGYKHQIILSGWVLDDLDIIATNTYQYPQTKLIAELQKNKVEIGLQVFRATMHKTKLTGSHLINGTEYVDLTTVDGQSFASSQFNLVRTHKHLDLWYLSGNNVVKSKVLRHLSEGQHHESASLLAKHWIESVNGSSHSLSTNTTIITDYGFHTQHLSNVWVRLTNYFQTPLDQLLTDLIPNLLSVSMAGYSWVLPYSAGGFNDYHGQPSDEEEAFVRMLQAIALVPASLSFTRKPWLFSERAMKITKKCIDLHLEHVPLFVDLAKRRIANGEPMVRPMWYVAPDDPLTYSIGDQFMLGDDLLVAPVVQLNQTQRSVYLPIGLWLDQHGKQFQGPSRVTVQAPLDELPYFKRKV